MKIFICWRSYRHGSFAVIHAKTPAQAKTLFLSAFGQEPLSVVDLEASVSGEARIARVY